MKNLILFISICLGLITVKAQTNMAPLECSTTQKNIICPEDRFINKDNYTGKISRIFPRGMQALAKYDQEPRRGYVVNVREISKSVPCAGAPDLICKDKYVANFLNPRGQVKEVFENNIIIVQFEGQDSPSITRTDLVRPIEEPQN